MKYGFTVCIQDTCCKGDRTHGLSFDVRATSFGILVDEIKHCIKAGGIVSADGEIVHVLGQKMFVEGCQVLFRTA